MSELIELTSAPTEAPVPWKVQSFHIGGVSARGRVEAISEDPAIHTFTYGEGKTVSLLSVLVEVANATNADWTWTVQRSVAVPSSASLTLQDDGMGGTDETDEQAKDLRVLERLQSQPNPWSGHWVVIRGESVVAYGPSAEQLIREALERFGDFDFVIGLAGDEPVYRGPGPRTAR